MATDFIEIRDDRFARLIHKNSHSPAHGPDLTAGPATTSSGIQ
jgi:hypothetical protein